MKERERLKERRAISPVISAIILSAVVMAVGGAIWAFSQGAMTITAEDYAEARINMTDTICERFMIEYVNNSEAELSVCIFNYGDVDIEVKIINPEIDNDWEKVASGELKKIDIEIVLSPNTEVGINVKSRRDNDVYYRYVVPS
ncbi:hypothetical protein ES703_98238 [subsurface metagenome]